MLKLIVLVDNNKSEVSSRILNEHGLSIYFKIDGQTWLYDLGASSVWRSNASILGLMPENVNHLILSHGHRDHTGGLQYFLEINMQGKIWASPELLFCNYYTYRHNEKRDISVDSSLFQGNLSRFIPVLSSHWISYNVALVINNCSSFPRPCGNQFLMINDGKKEIQDTFDNEIAVAIKTSKGIVVLSACSHNGVLNILRSCQGFVGDIPICAFIGGTHLVDGLTQINDDVMFIAKKIKVNYPTTKFYIGHCTGKDAMETFKQEIGENFKQMYSGMCLSEKNGL